MTETAINANTSEAQRLYQRGVAAARGGQKRVAAGLLTRSVQLDPRNESAWLWLSGVLDNPHQIAFCLQAVLRLNPANERATKGLRWLEDRKLLASTPKVAPTLNVPTQGLSSTEAVQRVTQPLPQTQEQPQAHPHRDAWWVNWRHLRREDNKVRLLLPTMLIVLLVSILFLHSSLVRGQEEFRQRQVAAEATAEAAAHLPPTAAPTIAALAPSAAAILTVDTSTLRDAASVAYLSALAPLRQQLRDAVDNYRNLSGQPGASSVALASAVRNVHGQVQQAAAALEQLNPPSTLRTAHQEYQEGLKFELQAWQDLLDFYGSYKAELANRAGLRFQEASLHFERARLILDQQPQRMELASQVSAHTPR